MSASLVVFDLDGTLIDSRRDIADAANALLLEQGAAPLPEPQIGRMVGEGAAVLVARAFAAAGRPLPPAALAGFIRLYGQRLVAHTRAYDGIPEVLATLGRRATLAVLTNKPLEATRAILTALELTRFFDHDRILGGDGPLARKPDPAGLLHLIASAGAAIDTTVMVGDSIIDYRTAAAAGTRIVIAAYGFGFDTFAAAGVSPGPVTVSRPEGLLNVL